MKKILFSFGACLLMAAAHAQTTYIFQPDACSGKDSYVHNINGFPNSVNDNAGNVDELNMSAWTYYALGGSDGYIRSFIDFTGLNSIPQGATITSAVLRLYGKSSYTSAPQGNSGDNVTLVQRVTAAWGENTVTWANQPATTTTNQASIPASSAAFNYNVAINVTQLVQDMVNQPASGRHGFALRQQTESIYRSLLFAASENPNPALRPRLEVTFNPCVATLAKAAPAAPFKVMTPDQLPLDPVLKTKASKGIEFSITPNPANGVTKVEFTAPEAQQVSLELLDQGGNIIKRKQVNAQKGVNVIPFELDNATFRGVYYMTLKSATGTSSKGVVIQK